jgi:hypothetical protein
VRLVDAAAKLSDIRVPAFHTRDAAAQLDTTLPHASLLLARLAVARQLVPLRRGLWAFPGRVTPLALPPYLTFPLPSYVSLQTALYFHGMVSQVPAITYAVSLARTRRFTTALGTVSIHHVAPRFFFGFEDRGDGVQMASPEKALVDFLYLGPARSRLFRALPELELPRGFSVKQARTLARRIESPRRTFVARRLDEVIGRSGTDGARQMKRR